MISQILLPLLFLGGCYCAPASWIDIGGKVGYDSHLNGSLGGHVKLDRDGLSVNGSTGGIIGASWTPTVYGIGHAQVGNKVIASNASLQTHISNWWQPSLHGEIGRNSRGQWLLGAQPVSVLENKFLLTPNLQLKTGDDARKMAGLPIASADAVDVKNAQTAQTANGALGMYAPSYPYGYNPYMYNPYAYLPNGVNGIMTPGALNPLYMQNPQMQPPQNQVPLIQTQSPANLPLDQLMAQQEQLQPQQLQQQQQLQQMQQLQQLSQQQQILQHKQ